MAGLRFLAPEVVQTSAMDCGPASLKALLEGHGISVSYGRLREACQTDVDGTSIDTMEQVAVQLGLDAQQVMIPVDHVLLPEARYLPALVVVVQPNGSTHFVVVWRRLGHLVQVMDPATGRHWLTAASCLSSLYSHTMAVPAASWREWAATDDFLIPLSSRMAAIGIDRHETGQLLEQALAAPGWWPIACLDATVRMVTSIVSSKGLRPGRQATVAVRRFFAQTCATPGSQETVIPETYWSVRPAPDIADQTSDEELVKLKGAVLIRVQGRLATAAAGEETEGPPLSPELAAALTEAPSRPGQDLLRLLREDGLLSVAALASIMALSGLVVVLEALLLRGFLDLGRELVPGDQRLVAALAFLVFLASGLLLELPLVGAVWRLGRGLELRLRSAFLEKIPRLGDRYFQSRLTSDMAYRSHSVHSLRFLPSLGGRFLREVGELLWTAAGIIWIDPGSALLVLVAVLFSVGLPLVAQPVLTERDLKLRNHAGALSRFYLDGLLGLVAIRTHRAGRAVQRGHEGLLVEWARAGLGMQRAAVAIEGLVSLAGLGLAALLVIQHVSRTGEGAAVLLLTYWALRLPTLGDSIALLVRQYPARRNTTLRLLEPLGALEAQSAPVAAADATAAEAGAAPPAGGVSITFKQVTVRASGHTILQGIDLEIAAGSHVAIVGHSGAGKSSLVGLLLGWHRAAVGAVLVDGQELDGERLQRLRRQAVWVDPAVQLWNRSLLANLRYGAPDELMLPVGPVLEQAELYDLLQRMPEGLQTPLGEGGTLVSGGEGQRVRLGRAMLRPGIRLAILDEPFRGLDRRLRQTLLRRSRRLWRDSTLLCITHDIEETRGFDRVLVIADGRVVEDGAPAALAGHQGSHFHTLLEAEAEVRSGLWSSTTWQRVYLDNGRINLVEPDEESP